MADRRRDLRPDSTSPFDIKAALLAPHAQHPVLVHFPIALFIISFLFDLLGLWRKKEMFFVAAYLNLAIAALSSVLAVATGLIAWQWQFKGIALGTSQNLMLHLIFGSVSCLLISLLWAIRYRQKQASETPVPPGRGYLLLAFLAFLIIALTGHLGSFVSGVSS